MVTVLVVDDDALVRSGLRAILAGRCAIDVVGEAVDGADAVSQARVLRPDVVLMDVRMPGIDGIQATRLILGAGPADDGGRRTRVLVLTTFGSDEYVYEALRAGAAGFLLKRSRPEELATAIVTVAEGESLVFPEAIRTLAAAHVGAAGRGLTRAGLTQREEEVLRGLARGGNNAEIAADLYLSPETVKTHVASLLAKLGVRDRTQAVIAAYESGFIDPRRGPSS
ncbi:response regulator transcription factor [Sinomonas sp. ASV322]|uniref:response regulator transcription factor n=1 Tax=Sinomonas sp. ASV322 TaxID=3041920 RepID=UPI0027DAD9FA|nr:response regulator transcription factor [Sinomonas sp. ASV322]MDQ4500892.1 response regulator transcription factor [Sinomonas sp. ASV322]